MSERESQTTAPEAETTDSGMELHRRLDWMEHMSRDPYDTPECRHDFECEGWTVDPRTSVCRVCGKMYIFWSQHDDQDSWKEAVEWCANDTQ